MKNAQDSIPGVKQHPKKKGFILEKLRKILENPKGKLIAVDLDGTLCIGEWWGTEEEPKPIKEMIDYVNSLYNKGGIIIIYTARDPDICRPTMAWLDKFGVCYHGVMMKKKPGADVYIDDKAINPKELL